MNIIVIIVIYFISLDNLQISISTLYYKFYSGNVLEYLKCELLVISEKLNRFIVLRDRLFVNVREGWEKIMGEGVVGSIIRGSLEDFLFNLYSGFPKFLF